MKVGLSTLLFQGDDLQKNIEFLKEIGLSDIEVVLESLRFTRGPEPSMLEELRNKIQSHNFDSRVHSYFWDLNPTSPYSEIREISFRQLKESIRACDILDGKVVTIHPGRCWLKENERRSSEC